MAETKHNQSVGFSWQILRYARFLVNEDDGKYSLTPASRNEQKWKYVSPIGEDGLKLVITSGHLLLTNGDVILENYFLPDMRSTMRGFIRGDSLLFVIKIKSEARKFRVRFAKGSHPKAELTCEDCASRLSYYFPVKPFEPPVSFRPVPKLNDHASGKEPMEGEVTVKDVTQVLSREGNIKELPLPYTHTSPIGVESEDLNQLLKLLLSEATFPAFVGAVERQLESIVNSQEEE